MEGIMMIQIQYPDGRFDLVKDTGLEPLIRTAKITCFKRSTGWASIGHDPIRETHRQEFVGRERRNRTN